MTARRVRQRIGTVLDWAYASGYRESEAPMRAITRGLPRQPKKEGHFAAMPYDKVPAFIVKLRSRESFTRLALQFAILTAARSGVRHAKCASGTGHRAYRFYGDLGSFVRSLVGWFSRCWG